MTRQESPVQDESLRADGLLGTLARMTPPPPPLEQMDLDEAAGCCEHLHDQAEALYAMLNAQIGEENA